MGNKYPPSFGNNEVVTVDEPIITVTGITPQPYVTIDATSAIRVASSSGTRTK
jgi:hypothetical protein